MTTLDGISNTSELIDNPEPYLIVSGDSHAGPMPASLREYCPARYIQDFDDWVATSDTAPPDFFGIRDGQDVAPSGLAPEALAEGRATLARVRVNAGSYDSAARLADMDSDGVTAEVIFAGAMNDQNLPWMGVRPDAGDANISPELRSVSCEIWNRWLSDFCSAAPERFVGVMQIPIFDVPRAVEAVRWGAEHGLRAINFAAPRPDYPAYNNEVYEPLWSAVEEVGVPLLTHSASGENPPGMDGRGAAAIWMSELMWLSRRGLGQMIFGGVFDRHPGLRLGFVEQRGNWVRQTLDELDSVFLGAPRNGTIPLLGGVVELPNRLPSDYFRTNCMVADSFMAPFEAAMRHDIGIENLMWGTDYPHVEGTWPRTKLALRNTFSGVPEADVRIILGANGVRFFDLDENALRPTADRIGPRPEEIVVPLAADEFPLFRSLAFREVGSFH